MRVEVRSGQVDADAAEVGADETDDGAVSAGELLEAGVGVVVG